jgi:hypothetical protein
MFEVPPGATGDDIRKMIDTVQGELGQLQEARAALRAQGAHGSDPAMLANAAESKPWRDQFYQLNDAMIAADRAALDAAGPPRSFDMLATQMTNDVRKGLTGKGPPQNVSDMLGGSDLVGEPPPEMLYRGVPQGADPMAPNDRGFTTWSNQRPTAEFYGPNVGEMPFDPHANVHLGTLEDARMMLGLGPDATAQDIAAAAMQRFRGANRTASYDLPPELDGVPREFIGFGQ